jgi:hypothetical protein
MPVAQLRIISVLEIAIQDLISAARLRTQQITANIIKEITPGTILQFRFVFLP